MKSLYNDGMRRFLSYFLLLFLFSVSAGFHARRLVAASTIAPISHDVTVGAQVGQFTVNLSGFIAPYASVVMTIDDTIVRSTVADADGYFFLSQILVQEGTDHFCLTAVDVRRLGQSKACFVVPPIYGNYSKNNIFLPPTLGVYKREINAGTDGLAWGYSMPGATVTLHLSDGRTLTVVADQNGYYQFTPRFDEPGTFELFADASYHNQNSEKPVNKVEIIALSVAQQVGKTTENVGKTVGNLFSTPWGFLLLVIPIIILIIILIRKLLQKHAPKPTGVGIPTPGKKTGGFPFAFRTHKLHHAWMKGVGY